jgi:hypothetical protein
MRVLAINGQIAAEHLRWQECNEKCLKAIEMAKTFGDPWDRLRAQFWAAVSLSVQGDADYAAVHAAEAISAAEGLRDRFWLGMSHIPMAFLACDRGNWEEARRVINRGMAVLPGEIYLLSIRSLLEHNAGDIK